MSFNELRRDMLTLLSNCILFHFIAVWIDIIKDESARKEMVFVFCVRPMIGAYVLEHGWIFNVPHHLWHGTSNFEVLSERPPILSPVTTSKMHGGPHSYKEYKLELCKHYHKLDSHGWRPNNDVTIHLPVLLPYCCYNMCTSYQINYFL